MVSEETIQELKRCETRDEFIEFIATNPLSEAEMIEVKRELLSWAIGNFDPPSDYSSDGHFAHPLVRLAVQKEAVELHGFLHSTDYEHLSSLAARFNEAIHAYIDDDPNPYLCIFLFLSIQDGMMTWLCDHLDEDEGAAGYYSTEKKRSVLAREFEKNVHRRDRVDLPFDTGQVIGNLETMWEHRNEIMHGGPNAVFDMNIATVCLLFMVATFEVVFEYRDVEPAEIPREWMIP